MCVILRRDARGVYIHICVYVCVILRQKLEVYIHIYVRGCTLKRELRVYIYFCIYTRTCV